MQAEELRDFIINKADDLKARDIQVLDVQKKSDITDFLIVCTGTSNTHTRSIAGHIAVEAKSAGVPPISTEGETDGEWVLVDFGDVIVHVMQPETRDFYQLEKLWG